MRYAHNMHHVFSAEKKQRVIVDLDDIDSEPDDDEAGKDTE